MNKKVASIDSRLLRILDELAKQGELIPMKVISERLGLSRRQIEYDLNRLDDIFGYLGLPMLERVQKKGILIPKENVSWYSTIFRHKQDKVRFHYNREERVAFIIIHIIIGGSSYSYSDFCEKLNVSRTSIFEDLSFAREACFQFDVQLNYDVYYNFIIEGSGRNLMRLIKFCDKVLTKNIPKELFKYLVDREIYDQIIKL